MPFGAALPFGAWPILLPENWFRYEVAGTVDVGSQPATWLFGSLQTNWSGAWKSIVPRRQLSQKRLLRTTLALPPAIQRPTPTGTGTVGVTSEQLPPGELDDCPGPGGPGF